MLYFRQSFSAFYSYFLFQQAAGQADMPAGIKDNTSTKLLYTFYKKAR